MRAMVQEYYGPAEGLKLAEIDPPRPAEDEVLVRVHASSVHADVWHVMTGRPRILRLMGAGLWRPKQPVPGTDLAGVVEAVGPKVARFKIGDEVFGECIRGMQWVNGGAWAEFALAPEEGLALKPANVSFEEAAAVPTAGLIALLNMVHYGKMEAGDRLLVNGAAGGVGTLAIQSALALGATVDAVDRGDKLELLRELGVSRVYDFEKEDYTLAGERYDLILDIPGNRRFDEVKRVLQPNGLWVVVGHDDYGRSQGAWLGSLPKMFAQMFRAFFDKQLPRPDMGMPDKRIQMALLAQWLSEGKLTPKLDSVFPLEEASAAMRYLQKGGVKGKIVLRIS